MKKVKKKVLAQLLTGLMIFSLFPCKPLTVGASTLVTIDPSIQHQTMDGWGTSLAWWADAVGGWSDATRKKIMDLVFGQDGLGLNIVRYNIGGGNDPAITPTHPFRFPQGFEPSQGTWDWNAENNQITILKEALKYNVTLSEAQINSPPYWMTVSGQASGSVDGSSDNLRSDQYDNYVDYLTTVLKHFKDVEGVNFNYIDPVNEPSANWWKAGGGQEGCHFDRSTIQTIINKLSDSIKTKNLNTQIVAADDSVLDDTITTYNAFDDATKSMISRINTHTYGGSKRFQLRDLAAGQDKPLEQSEFSTGYVADNHSSMAPAIPLANTIMSDIKDMGASSWVIWQAVEDEKENYINFSDNSAWNPPGSWGLIHGVYSDFTANGQNYTKEQYFISKQYYAMAQFSRFIKQGYKIIDANNDNVLAAMDPVTGQVVLVATNFTASNTNTSFDLSKFNNLASTASVYRTSDTESTAKLSDLVMNNNVLQTSLPANSITTFVIQSNPYSGPITKLVNDNVLGSSDNKFEYSPNWSYYDSQSGAYSSDVHYTNVKNSYVKLRFNGNRVKLYGALSSDSGIAGISIDGGPEYQVDCYSAQRQDNANIFTSALLDNTEHTVNIRATGNKNSASSACYIVLDEAAATNGEMPTNGRQDISVLDSQTGSGINQFNFSDGWTKAWTDSTGDRGYYSNVKDKYGIFRFIGNGVELYGSKSSDSGILAVSVDNGPEQLIDCYSSNRIDPTLIFKSNLLGDGIHFLKWRITGDKNSSATATYFANRSVSIINANTNASAGVVNDNTTGTGSNQIQYIGGWGYNGSQGGDLNNDSHYDATKDDALQIKFDGNSIKLYGALSSDSGIIGVSIDGGAETMVDCYSAVRKDGALLFESPMLSNGAHTLKARITGTKNDAATWYYLSLDSALVSADATATVPKITSLIGGSERMVVNFTPVTNASSYNIKYGTTSGSYSNTVTSTSSPYVITGLSSDTKYYVSVSAVLNGKESANSSEMSEFVKPASKKPLSYYVDCGTTTVNTLPSGEDYGSYNTVLDQPYGVDIGNGYSWGYQTTGAPWASGGADPYTSVIVDNDQTPGKGLSYKFELPNGEYNVDLGFKDQWGNANRKQDILVNGTTYFQNYVPPSTNDVKAIRKVKVTDGMMKIDVLRSAGNSGQHENVLISWIKIIPTNSVPQIPVVSDPVSTSSSVTLNFNASAGVNSYNIKYGTESGVYTNTINNVTGNSYTIKHLQSGTKYYFAVSAVNDLGESGNSNEVTATPTPMANPNLLYYVDCGSTNPGFVPAGESFGLDNSVSDQPYGKDSATDANWGYTMSQGVTPWASGGTDPYKSVLVANTSTPGKGINYKFDVPNGLYNISLGFNDQWTNPNRKEDVLINGIQELTGYVMPQDKSNEIKKFSNIKVTDSQISIDILCSNTSNNDHPMISLIKIEATVDKSLLDSAINKATTLIDSKTVGSGVGNVPQSAKDAFQAAIDAAKAVNNNSSAKQEDIDDQVADLASATTNFNNAIIVTVPVNKTVLTAAIKNATTLIDSKSVGSGVGNVPQSGKDAFQGAIDAAKAVNNNASAKQADIDAQVTAIAAATTKFNNSVIVVIPVDKTALTAAIKNATTLIDSKSVGSGAGNVPQSAKDAFQGAIDAAKTVNNNASAKQVEIDTQVATLTSATASFNNAVVKVAEIVTDNINTCVNAIENASNGSIINVKVTDKQIDKSIFDAIKGADKTVIFTQDGVQWIFNGKDITQPTKAIDLTVNVAKISETTSQDKEAISQKFKDSNVSVLSFAENGVLPGKATVRVKLAADWLSSIDKNNIYIYYYNRTTKKAELVAKQLKVDSDGYVQFDITHNSDYIAAGGDLVQAGVLPKTGAIIDLKLLVELGVFIMVVGAIFLTYRKEKIIK